MIQCMDKNIVVHHEIKRLELYNYIGAQTSPKLITIYGSGKLQSVWDMMHDATIERNKQHQAHEWLKQK